MTPPWLPAPRSCTSRGVWPEYHPGYFGAFVRDPDGNNVEAVHHTFESRPDRADRRAQDVGATRAMRLVTEPTTLRR